MKRTIVRNAMIGKKRSMVLRRSVSSDELNGQGKSSRTKRREGRRKKSERGQKKTRETTKIMWSEMFDV